MDSKEQTLQPSTPKRDPSSPTRSAKAHFLDLPQGIRKKIYTMALEIQHPLYLFQEPGSRVIESFAPDRPTRWLELLYTNRIICREASKVLYGTNHFDLMDTTAQQIDLLRSFLDCIGPGNAASLSHLCINFPVMESVDGGTGEVRFRDDGVQSLKLIQDRCTGLSTLEMRVHSGNCVVFGEPEDRLRQLLSKIDARFKAISSLNRIIVRVSVYDGVSSSMKDFMQELGWIVLFGS